MQAAAVVLALATLVGCVGHGDREPAWPKRTDPDVDGGESLAPRTSGVVAAKEAEKETKVEDKADDKAADAKATDKPADAKPTTTITTPDDVIIIDDIIIEIED
jgi:hypothetical protein